MLYIKTVFQTVSLYFCVFTSIHLNPDCFYFSGTGLLKLRRLKADLTVCFKILRGFTSIIPSEFFCGFHPVLEVTV